MRQYARSLSGSLENMGILIVLFQLSGDACSFNWNLYVKEENVDMVILVYLEEI